MSRARCFAEQAGIETLDLIEADHAMLQAAAANIDDDRARFHWADVTRFQPEAAYDAILRQPGRFTPGAGPIRRWGAPSSRRRRGCWPQGGRFFHGGEPPSAPMKTP